MIITIMLQTMVSQYFFFTNIVKSLDLEAF